MVRTRTKEQVAITIDKDIAQAFCENPYLKRSKWINDVVREKMVNQGLLKESA